ncbi:hypothetical protein D3C72_553200 [compost metagenome]
MPVHIAAGNNPIAAIKAVMITGRIRVSTPSRSASANVQVGWCLSSTILCLNLVIRITPFCTQIPNKAINPIPAEILKLMPVINKAKIPPIMANGTLFNTSKESFTFPKRTKRIKKITSKLIGTAVDNWLVARCWFSKSPAHSSL